MSNVFEPRYLRLYQIIGKPATKESPEIPALIPVSKTTFYQGIKDGRFPKPSRRFGSHISVWHSDCIRALMDTLPEKGQR